MMIGTMGTRESSIRRPKTCPKAWPRPTPSSSLAAWAMSKSWSISSRTTCRARSERIWIVSCSGPYAQPAFAARFVRRAGEQVGHVGHALARVQHERRAEVFREDLRLVVAKDDDNVRPSVFELLLQPPDGGLDGLMALLVLLGRQLVRDARIGLR